MKFLLSKLWFNCYEGEGDSTTTVNIDPPVDDNNKNNDGKGGVDDDKPTLSQKQVNKILAEEKRKHQAVIQKQVQELESLKKSKGLTEKEKGDLQNRIEELQNSLLSKEQLTAKEKQKLAEEHKKQLDGVHGERDFWKNNFHKSTIERAIIDEAVKVEAFSPSQIVALLAKDTHLVEVLDSDGTPISGEFVAKVKVRDKDKDGKPITLNLTVAEALTRMKEQTHEYGNLFKSNLNGGLGSSGGTGRAQGETDLANVSPEEYRRLRNKRLGRNKDTQQ